MIPVYATTQEQNTITPTIPSWVKQIAIFWGNGLISDIEFLNAIQYLVDIGLLTVSTTPVDEDKSICEPTTNYTDCKIPQDTHRDTLSLGFPSSAIHPDAIKGTVTRVIDGDTLIFNNDTYRLSIIDTPERGEDGFDAATDALLYLCPIGSTAYVDQNSIENQDKYGRYLGVIWCTGNDYSTTAGEYLFDVGLLKKFYTGFCDTTEAATMTWANTTGNWFYYNVCNLD